MQAHTDVVLYWIPNASDFAGLLAKGKVCDSLLHSIFFMLLLIFFNTETDD